MYRLNNTDLLAIDPGDVHCGMAWYERNECVHVVELEPNQCVDTVAQWLKTDKARTLVIEEFRLYPWMADTQSFSTFQTVETIGALKTAARWIAPNIEIHMQPAAIKIPTRKIMQRRHKTSLADLTNSGVHCADAELHGYYRYNQNKKGNTK